MTGAEFLAYVIRKFIRTDKDTEIYEAVTDIIADIQYDTKLEAVKEEAYIVGITTLGEYRIALPSDFENLIGNITIVEPNTNDSHVLTKISKQEYDLRYSDRLYSAYANMISGMPKDFCIYGGQIFLGPVPDKIAYKYQMNYSTSVITSISASTTSVPFTTNYKERNVLRDGVLAELYNGLENYEESNYWRALYTVGKQAMVQKNDRNIDDSNTVMYRGI